MNKHKGLILICVFILAAGIVIFFTRSFLYWNLVLPITQIVWYLVKLLSAIDQKVVWFFLVAIVFIASLVILLRQKSEDSQTAYPDTIHLEDRVTYWERQLENADRDRNYRPALQKKLADLQQSVLGTPEEAEQKEMGLPVERATLFQKISGAGMILINALRPKQPKLVDREFERSLENILDTLESSLETENDK